MSMYFDSKTNFLEPTVSQHGSHMIMTNVSKPTKRKYINIDTKFRDEHGFNPASYNANYNNDTNYVFSLPDRITDVKSMIVCNAEIPITYYNISSSLGNNYFQIVDLSGNNNAIITVPNGQYDSTTLPTQINNIISTSSLTNKDISFSFSTSISTSTPINTTTITNTGTTHNFYINFNTDQSGNFDKNNFKSKLGWIMGYRLPSYSLPRGPTSSIISESLYDLNGLRYLYLVIDEFGKGNQNSFVVPNYDHLTKSNIIAKISVNNKTYTFGSILPANNFNGYLLTDRRTYTGKIDIQRLRVQLVTDLGIPVNLNGSEFSFCLEVEHE